MLNADEIKQRLEDRNLSKVAEATGITYPRLWRFVNDRAAPAYDILVALDKYFEQEERQ